MTTAPRIPAEVFPPGEFIREELLARDWTQADLATILDKPLPAVNEIIAGRKMITPESATALGDAFGTGPEYWLNLQTAYRLAKVPTRDEGVAKRAALYSTAPINDMVRRGWIEGSDDPDDLARQVLAFFRSDSLESVERRRFSARKSSSYESTSTAEWAWYCRAVQLAASLDASRYSHDALASEGLPSLRRLAASVEDAARVPALLAEFGIRLVIVEGLKRTQLDGAAFWLTPGVAPAIALTMRCDRIDFFWFTLAHELAHILHEHDPVLDVNLVGKQRMQTGEKPQWECDADRFASDFLIPAQDFEGFIHRVRPHYSKTRINEFASQLGIHPGILVGQLQHRREVGLSHRREMLVSVRNALISTARTDGFDT